MTSTRRSFLKTSALAAGAAALVAPELIAQRGGGAPTGPLPESITALKSMRDLAKPITPEERMDRIENARKLMWANKLDAFMLMGGTSMDYFCGVRWGQSERMFALIIPSSYKTKAAPFFVCPKFEEDRAMELISKSPLAKVKVLTWEEDESPWQRIKQGLADSGVSSGTIGIEETVRFVFSDNLAKEASGIHIASGTPISAGCRMHKSPAEFELLTLANKVTWTAYKAAYAALREGMTQYEFGSLVSAAHSRLGFPGGCSTQVGEYSALPHGSIQPQVIKEGTIILIDGGCSVEGYQSDISRTFVLGKPTEKMLKVFEIEHRAQSAALAAAKPGVAAGSVDAAARKVIVDAGYGPGYKYFGHRVGHGIGMDGHEWPYLVKDNPLKLEPGMCFSDEPGVYIRGEFGVRLEDCMHITETGAELFTPQSESLEKPF